QPDRTRDALDPRPGGDDHARGRQGARWGVDAAHPAAIQPDRADRTPGLEDHTETPRGARDRHGQRVWLGVAVAGDPRRGLDAGRLEEGHAGLRSSGRQQLDVEAPRLRVPDVLFELSDSPVRQRELEAPHLAEPALLAVLRRPVLEAIDDMADGAHHELAGA